MHWRNGLAVALILFAVFLGCDSQDKATNQKAQATQYQRIAVTNYPLYCMVQSICEADDGPVKEVIYVGPMPDSDPHSWMPSTDQIRDLQNVDLIVCNGPGAVFANWMDKVTIDESKLCKTTDAIKLTEFVVVKDYQLVHSHGPEGEHSHSWVVPQSWLSPRIARKQATKCFERIVEVYGESKQHDDGFADLQKQFDELEAVCEKLQQSAPRYVVASSTPDIQYLTRELGWTDRYLQWTESRDVAVAEKELAAMRARALKEDTDSPTTESAFLWSGSEVDSLKSFVDGQWKASAVIDLIALPKTEAVDSKGYFERMAANLSRIGDSIE